MSINFHKNIRHLNLHLCAPGCWAENHLPFIRPVNLEPPPRLISFKECLKSDDFEAGVHFFIDDVDFEKFWTCPEKYINRLKKFACVIIPDFSIYYDAPIPVQQWNLYRSRVLGMYMQNNEIKVVPSIPFAGFDFNHYALIGLPKNSMVCVSTVGSLHNENSRRSFQAGLDTLVFVLQPSLILVYGDCGDFNFHNIKTMQYDKFKIPTRPRKRS